MSKRIEYHIHYANGEFEIVAPNQWRFAKKLAQEGADKKSLITGKSKLATLVAQAVAFVIDSRRASIWAVQRKFRIGYNRAARLIETMESAGIVSEMNSNGNREVLSQKVELD